ncbi:MAG: T9SS type A sorting domain-containing protein [Bacteroidetes bacterium]|nr:T9SS type A sorting domain-containing protein [Bacteroidota bacterium]
MIKFNSKNINITSIIILILVSIISIASSGGIVGKTKKNGNGCTCHNTNLTTAVSVIINGPSELKVGETGTFSVAISGGPLSAAGVNIAATGGTLSTISGEGLQFINDELTQTQPKTPTTNTVTFQFKFTAPNQTGSATIYATANSVNLSSTNAGDQWNNSSNKTLTITPTTNIADKTLPINFSLEQNYPNPFNPSTTIQYSIVKENLTTLEIINESGVIIDKIISEVKRAGTYKISFNANNLPTGVYYYRLKSGSESVIKKMIFLK